MPVPFSLSSFEVPMAATSKIQYDFIWSNLPDQDLLRVDTIWNPSQFAGQMSSFSSWGPTDGLTLKPEITGIGGNVFSAYCGNQFAVMSGTSMAAPQVAGMAALVAQYIEESGLAEKTGLTPRVLAQSLLMSTAEPIVDGTSGMYYPVIQQGAGLANVGKAVSAQSYVLVDGQPDGKVKAELGDDPNRTGKYLSLIHI